MVHDALLRVEHRASRCVYIFVARLGSAPTPSAAAAVSAARTAAGPVPGARRAAPPRPSPSARADAALARHPGARPVHRHRHRRRHRLGQDVGLHVSRTSSRCSRIAPAIPTRKVGGLVLEVKGDFCQQVRDILERHGRGDDYVEVSLDSPYRYNPLHNDLDAYALAYGIATLMTNLFGRGKEPFWQQASTNLVKFVILLHQMLDDYVTLFQVYEHVINPDKLRARIAEGRAPLQRAATAASSSTSASTCSRPRCSAWTWHDDEPTARDVDATGRRIVEDAARRRRHSVSRRYDATRRARDGRRQAWRSSRP